MILHLLEKSGRLPWKNEDAWKGKDTRKDRDAWKELFRCGNLMPDAVEKKDKQQSHFWNEAELDNVVIPPDVRIFMKKYKEKLSLEEPLLLGYFTHLCLDEVFYRQFYPKYAVFCNKEGKEEALRDRVAYGKIIKTGECKPLCTVLSDAYVYGDYTRLNQYLIEKYEIRVPWERTEEVCPVAEAGKPDMKKVFSDLKGYISEKCEDRNLKVFSAEALDEFLWEMAEILKEKLTDFC